MTKFESDALRNEVVQTILSRRTIRSGFDRQRGVPRAVLEVVTACGLAAPSSKNAQPWRFHVVTSTEFLDEIAEWMVADREADTYVPRDPRTGEPHAHWPSSVIESAAMIGKAPAAILIENRGVFSGGRATLQKAEPGVLRGSLTSYQFECIGLGTAIANLWLSALSLGLSAFFMGDVLIAEAAIRRRLGIEGDVVGLLGLGYSTAVPLPVRMSPEVTQTDHPVVWH